MKYHFILLPIILVSLLACAHSIPFNPKSGHSIDRRPFIIKVYQDYLNHLAGVRYSECPMYPSCSRYSQQCIQKNGFGIGWMMTIDRLIRCGRDDLKLSPRIFVNGKWKFYDPVVANDFLFNKP